MVHLLNFDPYQIPYQARVLELIRKKWNWDSGRYLEILLSGGVGSAKSTLLAHIAVTHCLFNRRALVAVCRRSLPDLKRTLIQEILDHLAPLKEGKNYLYNHSTQSFWFPQTDSRIGPVTWADRHYKKIRSLKLSCVIIEEGVENDEEDFQAFLELKARLRRRPIIKENLLIVATNPDSPDHWLYRYFIEPQPHDTRFVFYSTPFDNPFLPPGYIEQLKNDLDPINAERLIHGRWVRNNSKIIYSSFSDSNILPTITIREDLPLDISFDFNVAIGKPLSTVIGQYDKRNDCYYVIDSVTIETISTDAMTQELISRGYIVRGRRIRIFGDATGRARSTKSLSSDYDIIASSLAKVVGNEFEICVPTTNPPIKERHNRVNAVLCNANNERRCLIASKAQMLIKGLRLTALKEGSGYLEDDSKDYQHVTTALGYWICYIESTKQMKPIYCIKR